MSDNDPTGIWQDFREATDRANELQIWYNEATARLETCSRAAQVLEDERNEAREANKAYTVLIALDRDEIAALNQRITELEQAEVDFKDALESAQRNYSEVVEMLKTIGAALNVRTLSEIIPAIEAALDHDHIAQSRRIAELELNHVYMNERILVAEGKA